MSDLPPEQLRSLKYLEVALAEAQVTVRAYDTKAQIIGVGYTFALNIVASVATSIPTADDKSLLFVLIFWGVVMAPLFLFGFVIYPSRRTAPKVDGTSDLALNRVLYVETSRHGTVEDLEIAAASGNWLRELSFEVLKVSKLRELKRGRFVRALYATAFSFAFLFAIQLWRVL